MKTKKRMAKIKIRKEDIKEWARRHEGTSARLSSQDKDRTTWKPTPSLANVLFEIRWKVNDLLNYTTGMDQEALRLTQDLYCLTKCYDVNLYFEGTEGKL